MKRALVTGGAGFIGSNLAVTLEETGVGVVIIDDFTSGDFKNLKDFKGDIIAADISRPQDWVGRVGSVDMIFHQAAITDTTVMDQKRMMEVNVEGFRNILSFAVETGVRRVVYASSAGVYGAAPCPMSEKSVLEPMNVYGFSKKIMEQVGWNASQEEAGLTVIGLRYFNVYGPREEYKNKAASMIWQLYGQMKAGKRPRIFKNGEQYRDFIYIRDVIKANLIAANAKKSGVYNVCSGRVTTFNRIIEVLNGVLGKSYTPEYFDNPYSFYQNETKGDPHLAASGLGFTAGFSIEEGIQDYFGEKREAVLAA